MKDTVIDLAKRIAIATAVGVISHYAAKAIVEAEQKAKAKKRK
jgi:hypothetical protein